MPTWSFPFARSARVLLAPLAVTPATTRVTIDDDLLDVRFGWWRLRTPRSNVAGASVAGPYSYLRVIGPHLSLADRGVTFGTNTDAGVCVLFHRPEPALLPGHLAHPGLTVTVADPQSLVDYLVGAAPI